MAPAWGHSGFRSPERVPGGHNVAFEYVCVVSVPRSRCVFDLSLPRFRIFSPPFGFLHFSSVR